MPGFCPDDGKLKVNYCHCDTTARIEMCLLSLTQAAYVGIGSYRNQKLSV